MTPGHLASSNKLADHLASSTELADKRTSLAVTRTIVALDRTLMAWVRTSTSLISFGFTIYKFFQYLKSDTSLTDADRMRLLSPRGVALVMIGLGVIALTLATIDYRKQRN